MNGIHYCKILTSVVLTWDLKKYCIRCRWNDGHTNTCEAHLPLHKNLIVNKKIYILLWLTTIKLLLVSYNIKIKSKASKYHKQFKGDRQQIVVARNMYRSYKLFMISRIPKICAIPQQVSAPLNPIPIVEHFRRSQPQWEQNWQGLCVGKQSKENVMR